MQIRTRHLFHAWLCAAIIASFAALPPAVCAADRPVFKADGKEYRFDTGLLRGTLRREGKSLGLGPVTAGEKNEIVSTSVGLFSHYRLLDADTRYGPAAWDWASESRLMPDGSVQVRWTADAQHPFDLEVVYRWASAGALDVTTTVTARKDLKKFESFLASYFAGMTSASAYVKQQGGAAMIPALKEAGDWQAFPRDRDAAAIIGDGRWTRPPNPVDWVIRQPMAAPLAMRKNARTSLTALVMAPAEDCFAVLMPYQEEAHRSLYLSLIGRDLKSGEKAIAHSRLVIGKDISDQQAIEMYRAYIDELKTAR